MSAWFPLIAIAAWLSACGAIMPRTITSSEYRYRFQACGDEEHRFSSKRDYCDALRDDAFNGHCAQEERKRRYDDDCR